MTLSNQVALVTGAGQGIGKASALALAAAGAMSSPSTSTAAGPQVTATAIMALRRQGLAIAGRRRRALRDIDRMVRQAVDAFGRIDILVNNAGVTRRADIMDLTEEDWDRIHRVNAKGVFFCLQRVAREMIPRRSGRIINIASIAGQGLRRHVERHLRGEQGRRDQPDEDGRAAARRHNINVNAVCPGITRTALSEANVRGCRAEQEGVTRRGDGARAGRRHPAQARQRARGHRRRWWCSWPRPARATSPASPSTSMAA